jgi:hypothetical protein
MSSSFQKRPRVRPEADANLTSFWSSLHDISPQNGLLRFPVKYRLVPKHREGIYIRKAYEDLFTLICQDLNPKDHNNRIHRFTIAGTPGTGKTIFLLYVLWRLANMKTIKTVIICPESDSGTIYVFQHDRCWWTSGHADIDELLDDSTAWYLVDYPTVRPAEVKATTILISSFVTQHDIYFRYSDAAHPYYLPVWSWEELKIVASLWKKNMKVVEERYNLIGGNPRYIFDRMIDLKKFIGQIADSLPLRKFSHFAFGAESDDDLIGHLIVHYLVDPTYSDYSLVFSSKYVISRFFKSFIIRDLYMKGLSSFPLGQLRRLLFSMTSSSSLFSLQTNLFGYLAHRLLSIGGKFVGRSLYDGSVLELNVPRRAPKMFHNLSECIDPNIYYMARSCDYPCIDSIVLGSGCFRMTMTESHAISEDEMREITKELKVDNFYFVVPDRIFEKFGRQKLVEMMECEEAIQEQAIRGQTIERQMEQGQALMNRFSDAIPNLSKNVEQEVTKTQVDGNSRTDLLCQYVICIPLTNDWEKICHVLKSNSDLFEEAENPKTQR